METLPSVAEIGIGVIFSTGAVFNTVHTLSHTAEFGFSTDRITINEGQEVTLRLVNAGVVEHNIDIPSLDILVTAGPGEPAETSFVVPGPYQSGDFCCSLPGHTEAGMVGRISIDVAPQVQETAAARLPKSWPSRNSTRQVDRPLSPRRSSSPSASSSG
jgi:plastocyanin